MFDRADSGIILPYDGGVIAVCQGAYKLVYFIKTKKSALTNQYLKNKENKQHEN